MLANLNSLSIEMGLASSPVEVLEYRMEFASGPVEVPEQGVVIAGFRIAGIDYVSWRPSCLQIQIR